MNDLELLDKYCEQCVDYIHPLLLRDIESRGLYGYIISLPRDVNARKSVVRAKLAKAGKAFGDPEIDHIASEIHRMEALRNDLMKTNIAEAHKVLPLLKEMLAHTEALLNYYSSNNTFIS